MIAPQCFPQPFGDVDGEAVFARLERTEVFSVGEQFQNQDIAKAVIGDHARSERPQSGERRVGLHQAVAGGFALQGLDADGLIGLNVLDEVAGPVAPHDHEIAVPAGSLQDHDIAVHHLLAREQAAPDQVVHDGVFGADDKHGRRKKGTAGSGASPSSGFGSGGAG